MKPDKILSMTGIAAKAGKLVSGEFSTEKAVKTKKAHLVMVASDASDNTKKHFLDMCTYRSIAYYEYADKEMLGKCIGKDYRASLAVIDENLAKAIYMEFKKMEQLNNGGSR